MVVTLLLYSNAATYIYRKIYMVPFQCLCDVRGHEVERRRRNHKVGGWIPGNGCQLRDFHRQIRSARLLVVFPGSRIERD